MSNQSGTVSTVDVRRLPVGGARGYWRELVCSKSLLLIFHRSSGSNRDRKQVDFSIFPPLVTVNGSCSDTERMFCLPSFIKEHQNISKNKKKPKTLCLFQLSQRSADNKASTRPNVFDIKNKKKLWHSRCEALFITGESVVETQEGPTETDLGRYLGEI